MTPAELHHLLHSSRPVASPALAARVREITVGAAKRPISALERLRGPRIRLALVPAAAVLAVVAGAGVVGALRSGERNTQLSATESSAAGKTRAGANDAVPSAALPITPGRPQRYQAELTLRFDDAAALSRGAQRALEITRSLDGYVVSSVIDLQGENGSASLTLRVPSSQAQDAVVRLSALGEIVSQRVSLDDLQASLDELGRRQAALTAEIAGLVRELAKPGLTAEERIALRARLAQARQELGDVLAQRQSTAEEARFATIFVALQTDGAVAVPGHQSRLERAVREAGGALAWELSALVYALIVVSPLLVAAGIGVLWLRRRRRHEDERLLDA